MRGCRVPPPRTGRVRRSARRRRRRGRGHRRQRHLFAVAAAGGPGRCEDPRGRGQVQTEGCGDALVVVDGGPRLSQVTGGSVSLVDDGEVEWGQLLPVQGRAAGERGLQRATDPARRIARILAVDEGGIRCQDHDRPGPGPQGELDRVRRRPHAQSVQDLVLLDRAHRHHRRRVPDPAPRLSRLHQQFKRRHHDQDPPVPVEVQGGGGSGVGLARTGRGDDRRPQTTPRLRGACRSGTGLDNPPLRFHLMLTEPDHELFPPLNHEFQAIDIGLFGT